MLIIPAIDIQDGCVVRLVQGKRDKKIYSKDPVKTARHWIKQGARLLHVVDLDGANTGEPKNIEAVELIVKGSEAKVEFGGGVRSAKTIRALLDSGVYRLILGTKALDKAFLSEAFKEFKDKIIVSLDAKDGKIYIRGWIGQGCTDALKFALDLKEVGFKKVIYTDISKDGTLTGPNIMGIKKC